VHKALCVLYSRLLQLRRDIMRHSLKASAATCIAVLDYGLQNPLRG